MTTNQSNQQVPDNIVDLIKKCLRLTESPNEFEASAAMAKAQELLLKYNLTMSSVKDIPSEDADFSQMVDCFVPSVKFDSWLRILYGNVAQLNFCKVIGHPDSKNISILGRMVNVEVTHEMTEWLRIQIERLCITACNEEFKAFKIDAYGGGVSKVDSMQAFKKSFYIGIVNRVYERLKELQNESLAPSAENRGLVVRLFQETREFVDVTYPKIAAGKKIYIQSNNGYTAGQQAGNKVSVIRPSQSLGSGQKYLGVGR